jgi:fibronectin-binding autotransporter adhesin
LIHYPPMDAVDGGLTKLGAGRLTLSATNTFLGSTKISAGTLALSGNATLPRTLGITVATGAVFDVSGRAGSSWSLANYQFLGGNGTVVGNLTAGSGSTISPGASIGTLTFSNSLMLAAGSTTLMEISNLPLTNDIVRVFGALTNGGTLIVTNISGNALAAGNTFQLFNAASYNGSFANIILPPLSSGLAWDTSALNTNGALSVVTVIPPVFSSVNFSGGNLVMSGTGGLSGANYYVLSSTSLTQPFSNWPRVATNQFNNGGFNFTNGLNTNSAQGFYLLQLP